MAVKTTKITIETEGAFVMCHARRVMAWCPGCQGQVEVLLLGEDTAHLLEGLPTSLFHIWSPFEGPLHICLRSLMQHSQPSGI
jgi:hypothetical protein